MATNRQLQYCDDQAACIGHGIFEAGSKAAKTGLE
jgi:hypothetical protein